MLNFKYKAVRIRQTNSGDWLVLFAASAIEIDMWAGVPQKKKIGEHSKETTGFQREENKKRIKEITDFYRNEQNIIQNPLLCALRQESELVIFESSEIDNSISESIQHGFLTVKAEFLEKLSLLELLKRVKVDLERRVPELVNQQVPDKNIRELKERAEIPHSFQTSQDESYDNEQEIAEDSDDDTDLGLSLTDESHILDFWQDVAAYISVLDEIKDTFNSDKFLDYSKEAIISFLRPIVVVDGQHRLRAAIESAKELARQDKYKELLEQAILNDKADPEKAQVQIEAEAARKLPISLLMNTDPAEQVFQFVVVNQKATPIKTALLGTIISTSLSNEELTRVSERLESAGIKLEESRAVTFLTRSRYSPFYGLVERGLASDGKDSLKWNVLASIVKIFRDLKDGRLFHENVDYADKWNRSYLPSSKIIEKWESEGHQNAFAYWHSLNGPWRDVFISFWTSVRDKLSDPSNNEAWHYWGYPSI
ncbi:ParB N-terminal domain-containing protein [Nostoc sp.]